MIDSDLENEINNSIDAINEISENSENDLLLDMDE